MALFERHNSADRKYFTRLLPPVGAGVLMVGSGLLLPAFMPLAVLVFGVTAYDYLRAYWFRTPIDKFFEATAFGCNGHVPELIDKHETDSGCTYEYKMPAGIDMKDLEDIRPAMELYLNAYVSFEHKDNVIITVNERRLRTFYDYVYIPSSKPLEFCVGYERDGARMLDLESEYHLLISGASGSGKSVFLRSFITSMILKERSDVMLHLVDFQRCELSIFKDSKYVRDFCYTPDEFNQLLNRLKAESDKRVLKLFPEKNVSSITAYNAKSKDKLKYHVVIVDEFAVLAGGKNTAILENLKQMTAQTRKAGIFLVIATQRPTTDICDGLIKANISCRVAFKMPSHHDSQTVLDMPGAEDLRGKGHGLLKTSDLREFQGLYLSEDKARELIKHTIINKKPLQLEVIRNEPYTPRPRTTRIS